MRINRREILPCAAALLFAAAIFPHASRAADGYVPPKDRVVVVISIDGFPGWEWQDPRLSVPNLWKLASQGVRAETATTTNPTMTWPSHTSMVTGVPPARHGVLYNGLPVRGGERAPVVVKQWVPKEELVQAPTVYDLAYGAGFTTAEVDWVAIHQAKTITWRFPEIPDPAGVIEKEMAAAGILSETDAREFSKISPVGRDRYWTEAAVHILERHKPNLLLFHLLNVDANNHAHGPRTYASKTAYAYADECVAKIVDALKAAGLSNRATILVVSDHGFKTAKQVVRPNAILHRLGLLSLENAKIAGDVYATSSGGSAMLYIANPARKAELIPRLAEVFRATEGVDRVVLPADFREWGLPNPETNARMGDLFLLAKDGYAFNGRPEGPEIDGVTGTYPGNHGYAASDPDMSVTFIASGYGIRAGATLDRMSSLDLGPTIAALLGLEMKNVEGRVLKEILVPEKVR
ncbi:MAG: alkaline phosphatase family protein [Bryobacterales bacterium]|nr:alkaline phosphatase family protein [Bryobacterales bacterium]